MSRLFSATAAMAALTSILLSFTARPVSALAATDTITWGGDNSRAGYQTSVYTGRRTNGYLADFSLTRTHNMDPAIVGSDQFAQIFRTKMPGNYSGQVEQIYSQPLVYTGSDGIQYVYVSTTQNNVYKMDAKTGNILASRNLHIPFLQADLDNCYDLSPHIGVIGTGVIDPSTDTLYIASKTYADQSAVGVAQGRPNGRWYLHAIDTNTLNEKPNFPVNLEGTVARNSNVRIFNGGIQNQRPGLLQVGDYIYVGFGSHCVQYAFTGWVIGFHRTTGQIVERFATEGQGVANTTRGASLWMSGGGITSDNKGSLFFATGNGYAAQLADTPVKGRNPPTSLEEAAVHMTINDDGSLNLVDFFMPYEKRDLDNADRDLGTSPLVILPSQFSCGNVTRVGAVTGKSGKTYWLNLDDLGGYKNGAGGYDDALQVYQNENVVYAGVGVYPLEGGYIYVNVIGYPTHVFQFSCTNGVPSWVKVADAPDKNVNALGVGHGTVTSLNDQPGTGLLWTSDTQMQTLKIYKAVPQGGYLTMIKSFSIQGVTKFTRPVFGDGIVYQGTMYGYFYGFGAPTMSPLSCGSSSYAFGTGELGTASPARVVSCTALVPVTINNISLDDASNFAIANTPTLPTTIAAGQTLTFNATFQPANVGSLFANVIVQTGSISSYTSKSPIRLTGTGQSSNAMLTITPSSVAFQPIAIGGDGSQQSVILSNGGNTNLTITSVQYSLTNSTGPFVDPSQIAPFNVSSIPSTIPANSQVAAAISFNPTNTGIYNLYVVFNTPVGQQILSVAVSAGSPPVAKLEFQTPNGLGWVPYDPTQGFSFGNVLEGQTLNLKFRVTNIAPAGAVALDLTVSKPPLAVSGAILGAANLVDLAEGTILNSGESATANLYCSPPKTQWNTDSYSSSVVWTMNTNGLNFGKQFIQFNCMAAAEQASPLLANGQAAYRYLGCYKEYNPGRQLDKTLYSGSQNTVASCMAVCAAAGYKYCGLEWRQECWGGNTKPTLAVDDGNCNYPCAADVTQVCGGNGVGSGAGGSFISLFGVNATSALSSSSTQASSSTSSSASASSSVAASPTSSGMSTSVASSSTSAGLSTSLSSVASSSTQPGSTTSSSTASTPPSTVVYTCPSANSTIYSSLNGKTFLLECYVDHAAGDLSLVYVSTYAACAEACSTTNNCVAFSWLPAPNAPCYMKSTIGAPNANSGVWGAKMVTLAATVAPSSSSISGTSSTMPSSSSTTSSATSTATSSLLSSSTSTLASSTSLSSAISYSTSSTIIPSTSSSALSSVSSSVSTISTTSVASSSTTSSSLPISPTYPILASTSTTTSTSTSERTSLSTSTSSISPVASPTGPVTNPGTLGYQSIGCYSDSTSSRTLPNLVATKAKTVASCIAACAVTYQYIGIEYYGNECWCGGSLGAAGVTLLGSSKCNQVCAGNSTEFCGGSNALTVYNATAIVGVAPPPQIQQTVGSWQFQGCYTDSTSARALNGKVVTGSSMTLELCASSCSGYAYFGAEYGQECYCGDTVLNGSGKSTNQNDCSMTCGGNKSEFCGAGNRLQLYQNPAVPVSTT